MNIILSTRNLSKTLQIQTVFAGLYVNIMTLEQAGITGEAVEDGDTLAANSYKKASFALQKTTQKQWCMADDTGVFIDALDGAPGIHAARWAGDVWTEEIMQYTLDKLQDVPPSERGASFKTVAILLDPKGESHIFTGELRGTILEAPRVPCQPNMPYSAIFQPNGHDKTWAEMTTEEENAISHRGQAFSKMRGFLKTVVNI